MMETTIRPSLREKFEAKYIPEPMSGCWLWIGSTDTPGYPSMGVNRKRRHASSVALELAGRPLAAGQLALHKCDVKECVNPDHLYAGNRHDNARDKIQRGRDRGPAAVNRQKTRCNRGHALSGDNLYVPSSGHRHCRTCRSEWKKLHVTPTPRS